MRRAKLIVLDLLLVIVATIVSFVLRANFDTPLPSILRFLPYVFFTGCAAVAILVAGGLDRRIWRYAQLQDHMRLLSATVVTDLHIVTRMWPDFASRCRRVRSEV